MLSKQLDDIIKNLKKNSIFRMSLGSKELFHSNFLEYLWDLEEDHHSFIGIINESIDEPLSLPGSDYSFAREKKNYDICIFHSEKTGRKTKEGENSTKEVLDLIIENKVKSIPYKKQLAEYKQEAEKNNHSCQFILLSLSESFPDNDSVQADEQVAEKKNICGWRLINYEQLATKIADKYACHPCYNPYIKDYCSFVKHLVSLKNFILPVDSAIIESQPLFDDKVINSLKTIRIHDLYIKLRASWFIMSLKQRLPKEFDIYVVHKYDDFNKNDVEQKRKTGIFLNADINQGNGQAAAWILNKPDPMKKGDTYEVVIQGKQYRHGISLCRPTTAENDKDKRKRLNALYHIIEKSNDANTFLNFGGGENVFPDRDDECFRDNKTPKIKKEGKFCCYDDSYIYRYMKIEDEDTIGGLMNKMIADIKHLYPKIPQI